MATTTILCALLLAGPGSAVESAETAVESPAKEAAPERSWGIGTIGGGGFGGAAEVSGSSSAGAGPTLILPTLELQYFRENGHSLDLSIPLSNLVIVNIFTIGSGGFGIFGVDGFYNFNIGDDTTRVILAPGLGLGLIAGDDVVGVVVKVPVRVGVEFLFASRSLGFKLMARPYFEADFIGGGRGGGVTVGGGAVAEIGFSYYGRY